MFAILLAVGTGYPQTINAVYAALKSKINKIKILYSRDHTGVGMASHRISPKTSFNSPIWRYGSTDWLGKTKPKQVFR